HFIHQQGAGHDQGFLVGEQHALGGTHRRQSRRQPGRADDRSHHRVHVRSGSGVGERLRAALDRDRRTAGAQRRAGLRRGLRVHEHHPFGMKHPGLLDHGLPAAVGAQQHDPEPFRVQRNDLQRAAPDAPGGTQYGEAAGRTHAITREPSSPSAYSGAAAVTLSMRSSKPPCPGSSLPLSLRPAARLNMLSVRSPMMENIPTAQPNPIEMSGGAPKYAAPPQAIMATARRPPSAPSQVLAGLTRGANFRRPKRRPAKYAPMSAEMTMNTSHSTACGPRAKPGAPTCSFASAMKAGTSTGTPQASAAAARCRAGNSASQISAI